MNKPRVAKRLIAASALLYVAAVAGVAVLNYIGTRDTLLASLDRELIVGASIAPEILAADFHDRATAPDAVGRAEDQANIAHLSRLASRGGFAFIFTAVVQGGHIYVTASSASDAELAADEEVRYFTAYDEAHPTLKAALMGGEPVWVSYTDRWGRFRAAALPETSPGGRPYLAVAEYRLDDIDGLLRRELATSLGIALVLLLASLPLFLLLLDRERRHARALGEANQAIRDAQASLVHGERLSAIGTLAAGIAHELNSPLMGIVNYVDYARRKLGTEHPVDQQLGRAERTAQDCIAIVRDLLLFARGDQGAESAAGAPVPLRPVVDRVIRLLDYRRVRDQVDIQLDLPDDLPPVPTYGTRLQQVLMNLLLNAMDAVAGQPLRSIRLEAAVHGAVLVITITDSGPGISAADQERIFEPFVTTKASGKGTGLGLVISRELAEKSGGGLDCRSRPGEGASFEVHWPIAAPEQ